MRSIPTGNKSLTGFLEEAIRGSFPKGAEAYSRGAGQPSITDERYFQKLLGVFWGAL